MLVIAVPEAMLIDPLRPFHPLLFVFRGHPLHDDSVLALKAGVGVRDKGFLRLLRPSATQSPRATITGTYREFILITGLLVR